ncbi:MAG: SWIM zinc finger family protein [Armatimonadota bacterium]
METDCSCPDWSNPCKHIAAEPAYTRASVVGLEVVVREQNAD